MLTKPVCFILLLVLGTMCILPSNVHASTPIVNISAKPTWLKIYKDYNKKVPLRDVGNGYFYQIFEEQIQVDKQQDYQHYIREIVSDAGIQNGSEIAVSFDPTFETLNFHEIIIWRAGKPINRLSANAFKIVADEQDLSKFIYQGSYTAVNILEDIRKGDKIEYAFTITGRNPIFNNKFCRDIYFQQSQPIAHLYKTVQISQTRNLNFKYFNKVPKVEVSNYQASKCYAWEDFQVKPAHDYENQPAWYTTYGYVQISEYNSWQEVADWALKINPIIKITNGNLAKQVAVLKAKSGNNKDTYFRDAVKLVQDEIRYMGIEIGQYSHKANNPEKIYNQRYGDCKDKSLLLASILAANGITANMVLINAYTKDKIDQYLPSPNVFNHAVVVATLNNKQIFVDPTMSYQGGTGTNIYFPQYKKGLIVAAKNNSLTNIPPSKTGQIKYYEKYTIPEDAKSKVNLNVVTTYTLNEADRIRDRLASSSMSETEKSYLDYYTRLYPKIQSADSLTIKDDLAANKLTTIEHYQITNFFKKDSTSATFTAGFYANYINDQIPNADNTVNYPLYLYYPSNVDYTLSVVLPSGWNIDKKSKTIDRDAYFFSYRSDVVKDTLSLNYQFKYLQSFLPVNKLDEYRKDIKQIKDDELSFSFTYTPGASSAPFRLNIPMLIGIIIFTILIAGLSIKIYRTKTTELIYTPGKNVQSLGGWLLFITIGLGFTTLLVLATFLKNNYFDLNYFNARLFNANNISFKLFFIFEALGNLFLTIYALFCMILMINRRDITAKYMIGLYIYIVFFYICDYAFAYFLGNGEPDEKAGTLVLRSIIFAAIWIPYFMRSQRVKHTLVMPYPANNYRYQPLETVHTD